MSLKEQPDIIFKVVSTIQGEAGQEPEKLKEKTGIVIIVLN
jgi:hypothetical protein